MTGVTGLALQPCTQSRGERAMHHQVCQSQSDSNIQARVNSVLGFGPNWSSAKAQDKAPGKIACVQCRRHRGRQGEPRDWVVPNTRGNSRLMYRKEMPHSDNNIRHERCRLVLKHTSGQEAKRQQGKSPIATTIMKEKMASPSASCDKIGYRKRSLHTLPCRASIRQRNCQVVS